MRVDTNDDTASRPASHPASRPDWVVDAVIVQIFPDRFRRSGKVAAQQGLALQPWGEDPAAQGFQGGDLYGVIEALDDLQELGATCLYLNPVFASAANHRYHTFEYFQVDPLLGGNGALAALVAELHRRGMRLILDGVFNHCGRGFWAFHHLLENGPLSPYVDWFHVEHWPLNPYGHGACGYHCWWNDPALPSFNHANPAVRAYLLAVARHWIAAGVDGWRLDVPDEVPDDFWREFRAVVRAERPDAWIVGELWRDARPWLQSGLFDGTMNYSLAWAILGWSAPGRCRLSCGCRPCPSPPTSPWIRPASAPGLRRCWVGTARRSTAASSTCLTAMTPPGPCMCSAATGRPWPWPCCSCSCCRVRPASITAPRWASLVALNPAAARPCPGTLFPWAPRHRCGRCWPG